MIEVSGGEVEVRVGDEFVIRLAENATTGYLWSVRELGAGLELVDQELRPPGPGHGVGAAGERRVRVRAVAPGRAEVVLELGRSWEPSPRDERRVWVTVTD